MREGDGVRRRFWSKVRFTDSCWLWESAGDANGYGRFRVGRRVRLAHRVAWELTFGPVPEGGLVLHHCDNPPCVRPDHLYVGTYRDNAQDMLARNRRAYSRGEEHPSARLTLSQVEEIRRLAGSGWSHRRLAALFGVGKSTVTSVLSGRTWR